MSGYAPVAADVAVSVTSRDRNRWDDLYAALIANPGQWLSVPDTDVDAVKRNGKVSVQNRLDGDDGPGGVVSIGQTADGKTVVRYAAPAAPTATGATTAEKTEKKSAK